eukprot:TRINITY_DN111468_c0_g1_i1.p1 TRINITY_DN111468_c0_g1~~TRINITY_DN111468_c0_g1_i1.p1  ORF type:complete len:340 (-),score=79.88 TRINITY_DN111468_c0_g1_i1:42-1016(-)
MTFSILNAWGSATLVVASTLFVCAEGGVPLIKCGDFAVHQLALGPMKNYQYIIDNGRDAVTVDAAWDVPFLSKYMEAQKLKLVGSLYTHGHFDHVGNKAVFAKTEGQQHVQGAAELKQEMRRNMHYPLWIGSNDLEAAEKQTGVHSAYWKTVKDGTTIPALDGVKIVVIDTPGHSAGGVSFFVRSAQKSEGICKDGVLFTGDTIFRTNIGRTDLPGADQKSLLRSLSRISTLRDLTIMLPGHSYDYPPPRANLKEVKQVNHWMKQAVAEFPPGMLQKLPKGIYDYGESGNKDVGAKPSTPSEEEEASKKKAEEASKMNLGHTEL